MADGVADKKVSAASSNEKMTCYHCKEKATSFRKGWQLRSGDIAQLCDRCGSAFEEGIFCERFHQDLDGWRDCVSCAKRIHCGCIMSAHILVTLDYGGICCADCGKKDIDQAEVMYLTRTATPDFWHNFTLELARKPSLKVGKAFDLENKLMRGELPLALSAQENNYVGGPSTSFDSFVTLESRVPVVLPGEQLNTEIRRSEGASFGLKSPGNLPLASLEEELSKSQRDSKSALVPLFTTTLTVSDAELNNAHLVIPKNYAEAFFPKVSQQQDFPVSVQDTLGKDWSFQFHLWANFNGEENVYTLEGLRDYMDTMQRQPGDVVEFFRKEPEGKVVMETKKASCSTVQPSLEV